MEKLDNNMPLGLAGIMRVKNEAGFIEQCVTSCIDALDELIIVYNDCTDDTADILVVFNNWFSLVISNNALYAN